MGAGNTTVYAQWTPIKYTLTFNANGGSVSTASSSIAYGSAYGTLPTPTRTGYTFNGWFTASSGGTKVSSSTTMGAGNTTVYAQWKANVYAITVNGMDVNPSNQTDSNGNPKYNSKSFGTLYYTFGDEKHEKGFYVDVALANKLPTNHFAEYCENTQGKTNFNFGGLFASMIANNGHSYASYTSNSMVLSSKFTLVGTPILSEAKEAGTLYALIVPKQYTITFNLNAPSYGTTSASGYTTTQKVYYNERLPDITMPTNTYYKAKYSYGGVYHYGFDGKSTLLATFTTDVTFDAYWGVDLPITDTSHHTQNYSNTYYIKNATDLGQIRNYNNSNYILLDNITLSGQWTPIPLFYGTLNGNGKSIKNLTINFYSPDAFDGDKCLGLFAQIGSSASIYDLNFYDASIYWDPQHGGSGWIYAGVLAGKGSGKITNVNTYNCNITVHREQSRYGGLFGRVSDKGEITNCTAYGVHINGNGDSGGLVGYLYDSTINNCHIKSSSDRRCSIKHYANINQRSVGGICGLSDYGNILNCSTNNTDFLLEGDLSRCTPIGIIVGNSNTGSIHYVGCNDVEKDYVGTMSYGGGWFGSGAYNYSSNYFAVDWGYAGYVKNTSIK